MLFLGRTDFSTQSSIISGKLYGQVNIILNSLECYYSIAVQEWPNGGYRSCTFFKIRDSLHICQYSFMSQSQGILVNRFIDSPILPDFWKILSNLFDNNLKLKLWDIYMWLTLKFKWLTFMLNTIFNQVWFYEYKSI